MNESTQQLLSILLNVKQHKPVLFETKVSGNKVKLIFQSKTSKVTSTLLENFVYSLSEGEYYKIDWNVINREMGYTVSLTEEDVIFIGA